EHEREREDRERHQDRRLRVHDAPQSQWVPCSASMARWSSRCALALARRSSMRAVGGFIRAALLARPLRSASARVALDLRMSPALHVLYAAFTGPANPTQAPRTAPPATTTQAAATEHRSTRSGNTPHPPSPATGPCQQGCGGTCCGTSS